MTTTWYVNNGSGTPTKKGRKKTMTPSTQKTMKVTRQVFDLAAFDNIDLVKTVPEPPKPATLEEALAAVGNDREKLLNVIHDGLISDARTTAYNDISGFLVVPEEGDPTEPYTGKFADDEIGKKINAAVLTLAKLNGYDKSLSKDQKRALKEKATEFLRANPAMLGGLQSA